MKALIHVASQNLLKKRFLKDVNSGTRFSSHLRYVTKIQENIAPYALKIGDRKFLIANGMDRQLVDFLGNRKSPEFSTRYFRANPTAAIKQLQKLYRSLPLEELLS